MTTALDLIESAMSKIGKLGSGEIVSAEDAAVCLKRLNTMMSAFEGNDMFQYTSTETIFTLPASTQSRTIGAGQQIDVVRPVRIMGTSYCRVANIDYPLEPIDEESYNSISLKTSVGSIAPSVCWFDGGVPTGNVFFWPLSGSSVSVHLITPQPGTQATSTSTIYALAPGWQRMIEYGLALDIAPDFGVEASKTLRADAINSQHAILIQSQQVRQMKLPRLLRGADKTNPLDNFFLG